MFRQGRPGAGAARAAPFTHRTHCHLRWRAAECPRSAVGDDLPRRRDRHQPRRHDCAPLSAPHVAQALPVQHRLDEREAARTGPQLSSSSTLRIRCAELSGRSITVSMSTRSRMWKRGKLELNEIGEISVETHRPLVLRSLSAKPHHGRVHHIDPLSNETLGAGMIIGCGGQGRDTRPGDGRGALIAIPDIARP